ncbi:hypothetical protein HY772_07300 [Candidatus Woesearchaeota archaeon]|nr:hypothetical protein [Candidatus Woesearchaeota archaeon]
MKELCHESAAATLRAGGRHIVSQDSRFMFNYFNQFDVRNERRGDAAI